MPDGRPYDPAKDFIDTGRCMARLRREDATDAPAGDA